MLSKPEVLLVGRTALWGNDARIISEVASLGKTYVEIGTLFGGSACVAGLAGCEVFCIDPLDGYYSNKHHVTQRPDPITGIVVSEKIVRDNWERCGLDPEKLHIYKQMHPPWPEGLDREFDAGLIDGDHGFDDVLADYEGMKHRVAYLMFHDIDKSSVKMVYDLARAAPMWEDYESKHKSVLMGVLRRK